jgi:hypothetical protein
MVGNCRKVARLESVHFWTHWTLNPAAGYISQRRNMSKRNLKIVTQDVPIIGICETCKMQFKSFDFDEAERIVRAQFEEHECKPVEPATTPCPERKQGEAS